MNARTVNTLVEDLEHTNFLDSCQDIISRLNRECNTYFDLKLHYLWCGSITNLVSNVLPSSLAVGGTRFLVVVDLDRKDEKAMLEWIASSIDRRKTKGSLTDLSWTIKVISKEDLVITVTVNDIRKIIVIFPLGLPAELPFLSRHSVEDYTLLHFTSSELGKSRSAKETLEEIIEDKDISESQLQECLVNSIRNHDEFIMKYLRPLWHRE